MNYQSGLSKTFSELAETGEKSTIPDHTAKLLFISNETNPKIKSGMVSTISIEIFDEQLEINLLSPDEPSTIFSTLPVKRPENAELVPSPGYYPSYAELTSEQRWIYLNWLTNITQSINIGYVFIYYYGLERNLLIGDFDLTFDEILILRQVHAENQSFDFYSRSALLNSALLRKRMDRLEQLYHLTQPTRFSNTDLLLAYHLGYDLGVEGLIRLTPYLREVKKHYLNKKPDEYRAVLSSLLEAEYGFPYLPFSSAYKIDDVPRRNHVLFANISFPNEIRTPALPSFIDYSPFINDATRILNLTHEHVKREVANKRKLRKIQPD